MGRKEGKRCSRSEMESFDEMKQEECEPSTFEKNWLKGVAHARVLSAPGKTGAVEQSSAKTSDCQKNALADKRHSVTVRGCS